MYLPTSLVSESLKDCQLSDLTSAEFEPSVVHPKSVYRNASLVAAYANLHAVKNLRHGFLTALNRLQRFKFDFDVESSVIRYNFGDGTAMHRETLLQFMTADDGGPNGLTQLPDGWQYAPEKKREVTVQMNAAMRLLRQIVPETHAALETLIGEFLFANHEHMGGGSLSDIIGVIWLSPFPKWTPILYAECIVHEYVHQCLFLEAMVNTIFSEPVPVMDTEGLVTSALLQKERGYDKSYHSAFVSYMIMQFYCKLETPRERYLHLLQPLLVTISGLYEKSQFLTANGKRILDDLAHSIETSEFCSAA